jgi:hypothetical protein
MSGGRKKDPLKYKTDVVLKIKPCHHSMERAWDNKFIVVI